MHYRTICEPVFYLLNPRQADGTVFVEFIPSELHAGPARRLIERDLRRLVLHVGQRAVCFDLAHIANCDEAFLSTLVDVSIAIESAGGDVTIDGVRLFLGHRLLALLEERGAENVDVRTDESDASFQTQ